MSSELETIRNRPRFSVAIQTDMYKNLINSTLQDPKRVSRFIASISSAVATNPVLQECDAHSILNGALVGEALNLSPSPQLGQYYLVPRNIAIKDSNGKVIYKVDGNGNKLKDDRGHWIKETVKQAQFQIGAKGYKQLAMRTGQYLDLDVIHVKQGEFLGRDKFTGKYRFEFIEDEDARENTPIIGYLAYFELLNGFKKQLYWTVAKMEKHADTYSDAFNLAAYKLLKNGEIKEADMWKYSSHWYKNFDEMADKTMIRQLISKWGIMSIEMQDAVTKDMAVIDKDGNAGYVDNEDLPPVVQPDVELESDTPQEVTMDDL